MSRIGKLPVPVPSGVDVSIDGAVVTVKGPKGTLTHAVAAPIVVEKGEGVLDVKRPDDERESKSLHGLTRTLVNNMVVGVSNGFEKKLTLVGVGYRAQVQGTTLTLALGYSHPIEYTAPEGVTIEAPSQTEIVVKGCDKQKVGQVASEIRAFRPPEPYKGKGVRYSDERVVRKEAKKA